MSDTTAVQLPIRGLDEHLSFLRLRALSPLSIDQRRLAIQRLRRFLEADPLDATVEQLDAWQRSLQVAPRTRCNKINHLSAFYHWAVRERLIATDPSLYLIRPKKPKTIPRPMSEGDLQVALVTAPQGIRVCLALAGWAGLRAGEVAALQRDDVLDQAEPPVLLVSGKGNRRRVVPLGPQLLAELVAYGLPSRGAVLRRRDGQPGSNRGARVSQLCNGYLHSIGITATFHQCRHRFGTRFYAVTQDLRLTQEVMGHSDPDTTAGYAAHSPARAVEAIAKLDQTLVAAAQLALPGFTSP